MKIEISMGALCLISLTMAILKLTGLINWSWWVVTSPVWVPVVVTAIGGLVALGVITITILLMLVILLTFDKKM